MDDRPGARLLSLLPRRPFLLERYFARWEFETPLPLGSSEVEGMAMGDLLALADDELSALWADLRLGYTDSLGLPLLRREIAGLYDTCASDDVIVCTGAEEAILLVLSTLDAGDHAIVITPCYQSLLELARAAGADVSTVALREDEAWALDVSRVRALLRPGTRVIVVNFPHNPTGALPDEATWRELVALADEAGARLVSDEVYRFLEHDRDAPLPAAADLSSAAVSIGVMSKSFALAGLRVGWVACRDPELRRRVAEGRDYTTICGSAPAELLATIALRNRAAVLARSRAIVGANLPLLDAFFARHEEAFIFVRPSGGSIAFPRFRGAVRADAFAEGLRAAHGVLLLPGTLFDADPAHFRIGVGRSGFIEALARFEQHVQSTCT